MIICYASTTTQLASPNFFKVAEFYSLSVIASSRILPAATENRYSLFFDPVRASLARAVLGFYWRFCHSGNWYSLFHLAPYFCSLTTPSRQRGCSMFPKSPLAEQPRSCPWFRLSILILLHIRHLLLWGNLVRRIHVSGFHLNRWSTLGVPCRNWTYDTAVMDA